MKKHQVESKYKDPDKYIDRLKNEIRWMNNNKKYSKKGIAELCGKVIVKWEDGIEDVQSCIDGDLSTIRVNDIIAIIGKVIESKEYLSNGTVESEITYKRIKTKVVTEY